MFEKQHEKVAPKSKFLRRLMISFCLGLLSIILLVLIGAYGLHYYEVLNWTDAFVNAALVVADMGLNITLKTFSGKIFVACFALLSGIIFVGIAGLMFSPIVHRLVHKFFSR